MIHDPAILSVFWGVYGIHTYIHEKLYVLARLKGDIRSYVYIFLAKNSKGKRNSSILYPWKLFDGISKEKTRIRRLITSLLCDGELRLWDFELELFVGL